MSSAKDKEDLRKTLLEKRQALSLEEVENYSEIILNVLSKYVQLGKAKNVYIYSSIKNEVDTKSLINILKTTQPATGIEIAPNKSSTNMRIPQGRDYDLVIVPVLGFDRRGYRLGYGGGYYDKFLSKNNCRLIVGLAYSFSELKKIPNESHDMKMDMIITEKEIIHIKTSS